MLTVVLWIMYIVCNLLGRRSQSPGKCNNTGLVSALNSRPQSHKASFPRVSMALWVSLLAHPARCQYYKPPKTADRQTAELFFSILTVFRFQVSLCYCYSNEIFKKHQQCNLQGVPAAGKLYGACLRTVVG